MLEELFLEINNRYDSNIYVHQCGQEICIPGHAFGPCVRDHYLIHFIISGKGTYYHCDKSYHLKKNDLFLISPGDVTFFMKLIKRIPGTMFGLVLMALKQHNILT